MHKLDSRDYFERDADEFGRMYAGENCKDLIRRMTFIYHKRLIKKRVNALIELCGEVKGKKILDVGCGQGTNTVLLAKKGAIVDAIDFSESMLNIARQHAKLNGVDSRCNFFKTDLFNYSPPIKYDIVFATGVTDYIHYSKREFFFKKMDSLTVNTIILSFPRRWHLHAFIRKFWLNLFKKCPVFFFSKSEYEQIFKKFGYDIDGVIDLGILWVVRGVKKL